MTFISLTRLRIRSIWFLPLFAMHTRRTLGQTRRAAGFQVGALLPDRSWTFWTMTAWDSEESMRAYRNSGAHKAVMPRLLDWCDEASVAHWNQQETTLPTWVEADQKMREIGRVSKVRNPSPQHENMGFKPPRIAGVLPIRPT